MESTSLTAQREKELSKTRRELERYREIVNDYASNPKEIESNRGDIHKIEDAISGFTPVSLYLQFGREAGEELSALVSAIQDNITKLLLQK